MTITGVVQYKCVSSFGIPLYDENGGVVENEYMRIEAGTLWECAEPTGLSDIRLESGIHWVELSEHTVRKHFVAV